MGTSGGAQERAAFEEFAHAQAGRFARLAYVLTGHREATRDLVQETLVALWRAWPRVCAADNPGAYARRVMVNTHLMQVRRHRVEEVLVDAPEASAGDDHAARHAESDAMRQALDRLSPRQRTVLVLRFYEGLGDAEIASVLRCRQSSVRSLATRGIAALRTSGPITTGRSA